MSTLRINNIEAKSVPASPTLDEKIKLTNSSGDVLVHIDGKTSGITTIGINTTDGNIKFDENSNIVVTGIITATSFSGDGSNLTGVSGVTINNNAANKVIMGSNTANTLEAVAKSTLFGNLSHGQNFLDDQNLVFGDASDMILIHTSSGAKSRIRNTNDSGSLDIESTLTRFLNKDGSTEKLRINSSGYVGVGENTPATILHVKADVGDLLRLDRNNTGAVGNQIAFRHSNSGTLTETGSINCVSTANAATGELRFYTKASGGSSQERLRILSNGHVAMGHDITNDTGMFKVEAADGQSDDQYVAQFKNHEATASRNYGLLVQAGSNSTDHGLRVRNGANNATHFEVRGDGVVSKPAHPSFSAKGVGATFTYFNSSNAWYSLGDTVLTNTSYKNDQNFTTSHSFGMNRGVLSNGNSCFNADTTVFTAPVDGFYHFCISLYLRASQGGGTAHISPWINNSNTNIYNYNGSDTTSGDLSYPPATRTIDVKLSAGDTFFWAVYSVGTDRFSIYQDYSYLSGYLIG